MFRKLLLTLVTFINIIAMYNTQYYTDLIPFYIFLGVYILSSFAILLVDQFVVIKNNSLAGLMDIMLRNGKTVVFLTFLSVIDLILFIMFVPDPSIQYLQTEMQSSFLFYALLIFLIPIFLKFLLEPKGRQIEELFWIEYRKNVVTTKPSMDFALFVLARIQMKLHPINRVQQQIELKESSRPLENEITTTTFPMDYTQREDPESLEIKNQNSLFDSPDDLIQENVLEKYYDEMFKVVPSLEKATTLKPLNMKPEFFLSIIIERTVKDEQLLQFFKNLT